MKLKQPPRKPWNTTPQGANKSVRSHNIPICLGTYWNSDKPIPSGYIQTTTLDEYSVEIVEQYPVLTDTESVEGDKYEAFVTPNPETFHIMGAIQLPKLRLLACAHKLDELGGTVVSLTGNMAPSKSMLVTLDNVPLTLNQAEAIQFGKELIWLGASVELLHGFTDYLNITGHLNKSLALLQALSP